MLIKSLKHFSGISRVPLIIIKDILNNPGNYYGFFEKPKVDYVTGELKKLKDGSILTRPIHPTKQGPLKQIQRKLAKVISEHKLPLNVHGGVKGYSNITNALAHLGYKYHFMTDLESFFPSIEMPMVEKMFMGLGYTKRMAKHLSRLSTFSCARLATEKIASIPQGSPSSTAVSNLVLSPLDHKLAAFCRLHNIIYTRYIDDMTFSSNKSFEHLTATIIDIITSYDGLKINSDKTSYTEGAVDITGVRVFIDRLGMTEKQLKKVNYLINHPEDPRFTNLSKLEDYALRLDNVTNANIAR